MMKWLLLVAAVAYASAHPRIVDHSEGGYETYWETGGEIDSENNDSSSSFNSTNMYSGSRIVGGEHYDQNKYPFLVEIVQRIEGGHAHICGGSLITERNVISAGHCFHEIGYTSKKYGVQLGVHDLNDPCNRVIDNLLISRHPNYYLDGNIAINDIAMVTLPELVNYNPIIKPVCLPSLGLDVTNQPVIIAGWGYEEWEGVTPSKPKELHTKVIKNDKCSLPPFSTKLCTQIRNQTTCSGDSGGPVVWKDPRTNWYTLVGIHSAGHTYCAPGSPSYHTRVTAYLPWILVHVTAPPPCPVV